MTGSRRNLIRLFDVEPDLLVHVPEHHRVVARERTVMEVERLMAPASAPTDGRCLAYLVVDGLMVRRVESFGRHAVELIGEGDLLAPGELTPRASPSASVSWRAARPIALGRIDDRLVHDLARWPGVASDLFDRPSQRTASLAAQLAMAQIRNLEVRLLALLWLIAGRWGTVRPCGVVIEMRLTHAAIAELACARRPSVTAALRRLRERGDLTSRDGRIVLTGTSPVELEEPIMDKAS